MIYFLVISSGEKYQKCFDLWKYYIEKYVSSQNTIINLFNCSDYNIKTTKNTKLDIFNFSKSTSQNNSDIFVFCDVDLFFIRPVDFSLVENKSLGMVQSHVFPTIGDMIKNRPKSTNIIFTEEELKKPNYNSGLIVWNASTDLSSLSEEWKKHFTHGTSDQLALMKACLNLNIRIQELNKNYNTPLLTKETIGFHDFIKISLKWQNAEDFNREYLDQQIFKNS